MAVDSQQVSAGEHTQADRQQTGLKQTADLQMKPILTGGSAQIACLRSRCQKCAKEAELPQSV
jgi:hypothetical protein